MEEYVNIGLRYFALVFLMGIFIFLVVFSNIGNVTGNVSADFIFQKRLIEGETLSGSLRILSDGVLPSDSIVILRVGDQIIEKPLFFVLDEEQKSNIEPDLTIYPEVKVEMEVFVRSPTGNSGGSGNSISGFVAADSPDSPGESTGSGSGSSGSGSGGGILTHVTITTISSQSDSTISFEEDSIITEVVIKSAKLNDGTPVSLDLIRYYIAENKVNIMSDYKENVRGFGKGKALKIPLSSFGAKTKLGEIAISIKYKGENLIKEGGEIYVPISVKSSPNSNLREILFGKSREQIPQITNCGETKCSIQECVLPNFDSDAVLQGNIKKGLVNVVTCSNLCASKKVVYACEQKKEIVVVRDSAQEDSIFLQVFDESSKELIAKIDAKTSDRRVSRVDISFMN